MSAPPPGVVEAVERWLSAHDRIAPDVIEGLYLVGSVAFGDWQPTSDIDIVAFAADPTDVDVVARLEEAHDAYGAEAAGPTVDGPVLGWADATSPPIANQRPWTLDGGFHFDGDCFEINPVVWFTLARYAVPVRGEAPSALGVYVDRADRVAWCRENLRTYWSGVRDQIVEVLDRDRDRTEFDPAMTEWCGLGVARLAYTIDTGDVTSKTGAGEWAVDVFPGHAGVLRRAVRVRHGVDSSPSTRREVSDVVDWMSQAIGAAADHGENPGSAARPIG